MSVRLKLTLSYAGFLMVAGVLLIAVVWVFLLRYVPNQAITIPGQRVTDQATLPLPGLFVPGRSDLWRAFAPKAGVMLACLLVLGLLGGWILAGRMLTPLKRITDATRWAASGSLTHRIALRGRRDEFRQLADAFDDMLARLEAHVAEQQRFAANASHELRTPLAITQALLDVASRDPNPDTGELIDRLQAVNTRAIGLTEALLLLSRAGHQSFTPEPVDLSLTAEEATETLLPFADERSVAIETAGGIAHTCGSPALLQQMTTNLVHNAIVHNLGKGTVWITTSQHGATVQLTVENTGEILSPQLVATLSEPFQHRIERTHAPHAGAGLGLAIVERITQAHDGTLTLTPRPDGGLRVTVKLPATPLPDGSRRSGTTHDTRTGNQEIQPPPDASTAATNSPLSNRSGQSHQSSQPRLPSSASR